MTNLVTVVVPIAVIFLIILAIEKRVRFNLSWNRQLKIQLEEIKIQLRERNIYHIYLIGIMGSGKTTVGKLLAKKLNFDFVDTDNLITDNLRDPEFNNIPIIRLLLREINRMAGILFLGKPLIEKSSQTTIKEIFDTQGEAKFRELESQALEQVANNYQKSVIATGGGIVTKDENWKYLSKGFSIWLDVDLNLLNQRLSKDKQTHRPLINQLESLLKTRHYSYKKANLRILIKSERTPKALVREIINLIFNELH